MIVFTAFIIVSTATCVRNTVIQWARGFGDPAREHADDTNHLELFADASIYWESRYNKSESSGAGSYGKVAAWKQQVIDAFVTRCGIRTVSEFGYGDGNQLSMAHYPRYVGLDVSQTIWGQTSRLFSTDSTKAFLLYRADKIVSGISADLALSLDVIYHLLTDGEYTTYLKNLFSTRVDWVLVYASNYNGIGAAHVRHHRFTDDVGRLFPNFELLTTIGNAYPRESHADFYLFRRRRILLSFTTFAARAEHIAPAIESMRAQSIEPDEIRCYTEVSRFSFGRASLALDTANVRLHRADGRLGSYKKLVPVLRSEWDAEDTIIITLDDDWVYRPTLIAELLSAYARGGGIIVDRGHQITNQPYQYWVMGAWDASYPFRTAVLSGSGMLIPANIFRNDSVLAMTSAFRIAPTSDDLWWTAHAIAQNIPVTEIGRARNHPQNELYETSKIGALHIKNTQGNDRAWHQLKTYIALLYNVDMMELALGKKSDTL